MNGDDQNYPWGDQLRYNSWSRRIREKYGGRIQKVSVNAGFTCPNRDGTKGTGGCIYCNNNSFIPSYCVAEEGIISQIDRGIEFLSKRYRKTRHYIAYFQAFSNTYAPLENLRAFYQEALEHPLIDGLAISTRPDCVDDPVLDYLQELAGTRYVFLEYGIESCHDDTLIRICRGHTFEDTIRAINKTAERGLSCTGHLIFGLPGETRKEMLDQTEILNDLPLTALKFHQLQIIRNTPLEALFKKEPEMFNLFSIDDYCHFVIDFLERLDPRIAIERLSSESPPRLRINPGWGNLRSDLIQKKIESVMEDLDTWQGKRLKN